MCGKGGSVDPGSDDPGFINLYKFKHRLDKTCMYVARVVSFALEGSNACLSVVLQLVRNTSATDVSKKYGISTRGNVYILEHNILRYAEA